MATLKITALLDDSSEVKDTVQLKPELPEPKVQEAMVRIAVQLAQQGIAKSSETDKDYVTMYPAHRIQHITVELSRIDTPTDAQRGVILAGK